MCFCNERIRTPYCNSDECQREVERLKKEREVFQNHSLREVKDKSELKALAIKERDDLEKRAQDMNNFIGYNPVFNTIDPAEQERMKEQNDIMWMYFEILSNRIAQL